MRVIAATNRDLQAMMRAGTFREDLYYRLQVIELHIPPLRNRREEIGPLVEFFVAKYSRLYRRPFVRVSAGLLRALTEYSWPGNVRELENMVKRLVVLQDEQFILQELARLTADGAALPEPTDQRGRRRHRRRRRRRSRWPRRGPLSPTPCRSTSPTTTTAMAMPPGWRPRPTASACTNWRARRRWMPSARPSIWR